MGLISEFDSNAEHVYNVDETMVPNKLFDSRTNVIDMHDRPALVETPVSTYMHMTYCICKSASGMSCPPFVLMPRKTLPEDLDARIGSFEIGRAHV